MLEIKKAKVKEMKAGELTIKKTESFGRVANIIKGIVPGGELKKELLRSKLDDLKLAYQHVGGSLKELDDIKKDTIAHALSNNEMILSLFVNRSNPQNDKNNTVGAGVEETNTDKKEASVECSVIDEKDVVETESEMLKWFMSRD